MLQAKYDPEYAKSLEGRKMKIEPFSFSDGKHFFFLNRLIKMSEKYKIFEILTFSNFKQWLVI